MTKKCLIVLADLCLKSWLERGPFGAFYHLHCNKCLLMWILIFRSFS